MISCVIPTLNAAAGLGRCLDGLSAGGALLRETIVSDGGSADATCDIAAARGCRIVRGARGRARQLIAGAQAASADWLLFLHADTVLDETWPRDAAAFVEQAAARERACAFAFAFDEDSPAARRIEWGVRLRLRLLKLPYGDQGLLISRAFYEALGGYRDLPLMEDVDLVRRIGRKRLSILPTKARTSADKYRADGFQRRAWRNIAILALYYLGVRPATLKRIYERGRASGPRP